MLNKEDLQKIEKIFDKKIDARLKITENRLEKKFDTRFDEAEKRLEKKFDTRFDQSEKRFDERLGAFTDEVLLPGIEELIKREIGAHRYDIKVYIDSKAAEVKGDIVSYIKPMTERDKIWKRTVTDVLERHRLAKEQELKKLADSIGLKFTS